MNLPPELISTWSTDNVTVSEQMFGGCDALVGEKGTQYDSGYVDKEYARIDGGPGSDTPGYFLEDGPCESKIIDAWSYTNNNGIVTLKGYRGKSRKVVIPANKDFDKNVTEVHISAEVMKSVVMNKKAISITVSDHGNPVIADGEDWSLVFSHIRDDKEQENTSLKTVDLSNFSTSNITNMSGMFYACSALTSLNLSQWDTGQVTDMTSMFACCFYLTSLDVSGWDTSKVTSMGGMFFLCFSLDSLDLSGFDTSRVTNMGFMFCLCTSLNSMSAGNAWSTDNVTISDQMFFACKALVGGEGTQFDPNHIDIEYARIDGGPDSETPGYLTGNIKGDINQDNKLDILDARLAKRIAMKDSTAEYTERGLNAGDLDGNGKITINEARKIKRVVLKETTF